MELLVSIAIMAIITAVVASNESQFGSGATLKNISNNLSLSLRQAQIYGISVKEFSPGSYQAYSINSFNAGYGVSFNLNASPGGDNTAYIFFADRKPAAPPTANPDGLYGSGVSCPIFGSGNPPSECIDKTALTQGHTISALCTVRSGVEDCENTRLDVSFIRPAVEAKIIFNADIPGSASLNLACVEISAPDGKRNAVVVYTTGQISVRVMSCGDAI